MADVTDPLPAGRAGIDGADDGPVEDLPVAMSTRQCAGQVVVALSGELDATCATRIGALVTTVAIPVPCLIVDLGGLEFSDCAGIRALARADRQARQAGGGLVLAAPGRLVRRVLDLTGLMTGVRVYSSVGEAAGVAPQRATRPCPAEIDLNNTLDAIMPLAKAIGTNAPVVVADMAAMTFCDSSGVQALLVTAHQASDSGAELRLVVKDGGAVQHVIARMGIDRLLPVLPDARRGPRPEPHGSPDVKRRSRPTALQPPLRGGRPRIRRVASATLHHRPSRL